MGDATLLIVMSQDNTALLILPAEAGNSLLDVAELEFQASLQLLLERACWVSGPAGGRSRSLTSMSATNHPVEGLYASTNPLEATFFGNFVHQSTQLIE